MSENVTVDSINLDINASAKSAETQIDDLITGLGHLRNMLSGVKGRRASKEIDDVARSAERAGSAISDAADETAEYKNKEEGAKKESKKFSEILSDIAKVAGKTQGGLSSVFSGIKTGNITNVLSGVSNIASVFAKGETAAVGAGEAAGFAATGWGLAAVALLGVAGVGIKVTKILFKLTASVVAAPFKKFASAVSGAVSKLKQFFSSISRVATYRLIRTALKEISEGFSTGTENAYYFADIVGNPLAGSLDSIATSLLYLKNSIGAAVAPIINALAPAVQIVVDKFVALVNTVNQFLSSFGIKGTWIKAIKYPTEYKEALDDTDDSAKKLKRTLLGFDEINALDGEKSSKSGANKLTAADYSGMFTVEEVSPVMSDFAANIKKQIENSDWAGIGTTLATKINGFISKANNAVDWDKGVGEKITKWLDGITSGFNSFVKTFDGEKFGNLVGNAITTAFNTVQTLFDDVDFTNLAKKVSDILNGIFAKIDGKKLGSTIKTVIITALEFMTNVLKGVDQKEVNKDIAGFFEGLDLPKILDTAADTFIAVGANIVSGILAGLKGIGKSIWEYIKTDFKGYLAKKGEEEAELGESLFSGILNGFSKVGTSIGNIVNNIKASITGVIDTFKYEWNRLITSFALVLKTNKLTSWMGDLIDGAVFSDVEQTPQKLADIYADFKSLFSGLGSSGSASFETGLNSNGTVGNAFGTKVKGNIETNLDSKRNADNARKIFGESFDSTTTAGNKFGGFVTTNINKSADGTSIAAKLKNLFNAKLDNGSSAGKTFGEAVTANINKSANGDSIAAKLKNLFNTRLDNGSSAGKTFGEAVTANINKSADGTSIAAKLKNLFNAKLDNGSSAGTKFGNAVTANINGSANGTNIALTVKSAFKDRLDSGSTAGTTYGSITAGNITGALSNSKNYTYKGKEIEANITSVLGTPKTTGQSFGAKVASLIAGQLSIKDNYGTSMGKRVHDVLGMTSEKTGTGSDYGKSLAKSIAYPLFTKDNYGTSMGKRVHDVLGMTSEKTGTGSDYGKSLAKSIAYPLSTYSNYTNSSITMGSRVSSALGTTGVEKGAGTTYGKSLAKSIAYPLSFKANYKNGANSIDKRVTDALGSPESTVGKSYGYGIGQNIGTGIVSGISSKLGSLTFTPSTNKDGSMKLSIKAAASGGVIDSGQMFIAREAGPELVGNIGRRTAVANTSQMVDAMAQGVYMANSEQTGVLRQLVSYAAEIAAKEYSSGGDITAQSIASAMQKNNRRVGRTVMSVAP